MLPFSLFLSLKYLRPKRTFLSIVTLLSVLGVLLGVAVLVIVLSVMEGFDRMWQEKILSFNAHITLYSHSSHKTYPDENALCNTLERVPGVTGAAPFFQSLLFVKTTNGTIKTPLLRGIDPAREQKVSRLHNAIIHGTFDVSDGQIVIGADLARSLGLSVGDTLTSFSPASFANSSEIRLPRDWRIAGIFEVGMWEFDAGYILASLWDARSFCNGTGLDAFQIMTADPYHANTVAAQIQKLLPDPSWHADTWMDLNHQLFAALRVEKNMMFFLLIFITIVAAFGITNTLITVTIQKTPEIGVLRSLGFSSPAVMRVFFWQGWIQGLVGITSGIAAGLLALHYRNPLLHFLNDHCGMELFPKELYHLAEIPACTRPADLALVAASVLLICTLAAVIPAWQAARLDPVKALRHD